MRGISEPLFFCSEHILSRCICYPKSTCTSCYNFGSFVTFCVSRIASRLLGFQISSPRHYWKWHERKHDVWKYSRERAAKDHGVLWCPFKRLPKVLSGDRIVIGGQSLREGFVLENFGARRGQSVTMPFLSQPRWNKYHLRTGALNHHEFHGGTKNQRRIRGLTLNWKLGLHRLHAGW